MEGSLKHSTSRKNFLKDGKIVKFYPEIYGYVFHEIFRILFQLCNGVYRIDFISRKRRITNEICARKVIGSMGMNTTKLLAFSLKDYFLEESFENGSRNLGDMEKNNVLLASKISKDVGRMTRALNDRGYYFIDNRSSNWLVNDGGGIIRTDLELFKHDISDKDFYAKCDYLSFVSSVDSNAVRDGFIRGYGRSIACSALTVFLAALYIRLADLIF